MIKIGNVEKDFSDLQAQNLKRALEKSGFEVQLSAYTFGDDYTENISNLLSTFEVEIVIVPLSNVPIKKPHNIIIAALLERNLSGECIIASNDFIDQNAELRLKPNCTINVADALNRHQLAALNKKINFNLAPTPWKDAFELLKNNTIDGFVISKNLASSFGEKFLKYDVINLNPKEVIPIPGSGAYACLVHPENMEIRKICQSLHHKATADVTNVERKIQLLSGSEPVHAYCYRDNAGNYHVLAVKYAGDCLTVRFSQSTSNGLAEKIHQLLTQ